MEMIFKKELKALFRNVAIITSLSITVFVCGILAYLNNVKKGYLGIETILPGLSIAMMLIIPYIVISLIFKDRKNDKRYAFLPITKAQIFLGRFFAIAVILALHTVVIGLFIPLMSVFGRINFLYSSLLLLAIWLLELLYVALSTLIVQFARSKWKAYTVAFSVNLLSFALSIVFSVIPNSPLVGIVFITAICLFAGLAIYLITKLLIPAISTSAVLCGGAWLMFLLYPELYRNIVDKTFRFISPLRQFDKFIFGVFDISGFCFMLLGTIVLLLLGYFAFCRGVRRDDMPKKFLKKAHSNPMATLISIVIILAFFASNLLVGALPANIRMLDVTSNSLYSVSKSTTQFVSELKEDVKIYYVRGLEETDGKIKLFLEKYCALSERLEFVEVGYSDANSLIEKYNINGNSLDTIVVESDKRYTVISFEENFLIRHSELGDMKMSEYYNSLSYYKQMYSAYSSMNNSAAAEDLANLASVIESMENDFVLLLNIESSVNRAVEYVIAEYIPTTYFATGHGEKNTQANPLDITNIDSIPQDAGIILINDPDVDYSADDIEKLLSYSDNGGRLLFLVKEKHAAMSNLSRLLAAFGVSIDSKVITEGDGATMTVLNGNAPPYNGINYTIYLKEPTALSSASVDDFEIYSVLEVTSKSDGEGEASSATVGLSVYKNQEPKALIISGADSFNADSEALSQTEKEQYSSAMGFLQYGATQIRAKHTSMLSSPQPKEYMPQLTDANSINGAAVICIFCIVIPFAGISCSAFLSYARKKRSFSK